MEKQIEKLKSLISATLPACVVDVDAPDQAEGKWWIDVHAGKKRVAVEYRPGKGFGIFSEMIGQYQPS